MLLYKSWRETRWRFLIGLPLLICSAGLVVMAWPKVLQLLPLASSLDMGGEIGRRVQEAVEAQRSFRGFIWSQVFSKTLTNMVTLFAVLLGIGGLLSPASRSASFTLSLPATRNRIVGIRAATGLAELLTLTLLPALVVIGVSPAVGESYSLPDALVHGLCLFAAGAVFFGLASLLSTIFTDFWRPLVISLGIAMAIGTLEMLFGGRMGYGIFRTMSGETWFRSHQFPWPGFLACLAASAGLIWCAAINTARRDF